MALDSEAKRWSMLQIANGPSALSHVINPTGSNFDAQVERLTLLKVYGGSLAADTTAPVLSNPTATATGATTATGTVDTDEGNGTLYYYASTNSSESAATIKASGDSQAVTATGTQNVSITGLTSGTTYYIHYVHDDASANESNVQSSASFDTQAGVGGTSNYIKKREDPESLREAARLALLRRRKKELLEQERLRAQQAKTPQNAQETVTRLFKIDQELEQIHNEIIEYETEVATRKAKRRKRDKTAIMLLIN